MLVARLPSLERGAAVGPIAVTDSSAGWDIAPAGAGRTGCGVLGGPGGYERGALGGRPDGYRCWGPLGYIGWRGVLGAWRGGRAGGGGAVGMAAMDAAGGRPTIGADIVFGVMPTDP